MKRYLYDLNLLGPVARAAEAARRYEDFDGDSWDEEHDHAQALYEALSELISAVRALEA